MAGILYRLKTGCQWKALPSDFGSGSTCHLRFQKWVQLRVLAASHRELLSYYDRRRGIAWNWSSLDSASVKAPRGGTSRARARRTAGAFEVSRCEYLSQLAEATPHVVEPPAIAAALSGWSSRF